MNYYPVGPNIPEYHSHFYEQPWDFPPYGPFPPPHFGYRGMRPPRPPPPLPLYHGPPYPIGGGYYPASNILGPLPPPASVVPDFSMPPPNHIVAYQSGGPDNPDNKKYAPPANPTAISLHKFSPDAPVFVPKSLQISATVTDDLQNDQRNQSAGKYNRDSNTEYHSKDDTISAGDFQTASPYVKSNNQSQTRGSQYHANNYKHSNNYDANRHPKFQQNGQQTDFQGPNSYTNHKSREFGKANGSASGRETVPKNKKPLGQALKKSSSIPRAPWHDVSASPSPSPPLDDDVLSLGESSPETQNFDGQSEKLDQENGPDRGLNCEDSSKQNAKAAHSYSEPYRETSENTQKSNGSHILFKEKQRGQRFGEEINTVEYYNSSIRLSRGGEDHGYRRGRGSYRGTFSQENANDYSPSETGYEIYGNRGRGKDDSHFNTRGRYRGNPRSFTNNRGDFNESEMPEHPEYEERVRGRGRSDNFSSRYNRQHDVHRGYRPPDFKSQEESESRDTYRKYPYRGSHEPRENHHDHSPSDFNRQHNERESYRKYPVDISHAHHRDSGENSSPGFQSYGSERGSFRNIPFEGSHASRGGHDKYGQQDFNSPRGDRGSNRNHRYNGAHTARGSIRRTQSERTPPSYETRQETNPIRKYEDNHRSMETARPEHGNDEYRERANKWSQKKAQGGLKHDAANKKVSAENLEAKLAKNRMNSRQKMVLLDEYNSDLNLILDANGYGASTLDNPDGFLKLWADVKATHGAGKGKLYFEVKVIELVREEDDGETDPCPHAVRVGWSTEQSTFEDGTGSWCLGYSGNMKFNEGQSYCESFQKDDVIGAILDLESSPATVIFLKNGEVLGDPSIIPDSPSSDAPRVLFPHISLKNSKVRVNFGQRETPWFPPPDGTRFIGNVPMEDLTPSLTPPEMRSDCEIVMLIGLPGSGKTTWAMNHQRENPKKRFNILGTDLIIELLSRHENGISYHKTFDRYKDVAKSCFDRLLKIAAMKVRNYIVDQTNVFPSARRRKLSGFAAFQKVAVVIQPSDRELSRRSRERTQGSNKNVPEGALREMKANFALPDDVGEAFHVIEYVELQENDARELVDLYNVEGQRNKPLLCLD